MPVGKIRAEPNRPGRSNGPAIQFRLVRPIVIAIAIKTSDATPDQTSLRLSVRITI